MGEEDLQLLGSQLDGLEGAARKKAEAVVSASKGKKVKYSTGSGAWGKVIGAIGIQRPYLNANGDLMDQSIVTINVLK